MKYPIEQIEETVQKQDNLGKLEQIKSLEHFEKVEVRVLGLALCHDEKQNHRLGPMQ